jgi:CHASE3 domain sensor protein
MPISSRFVINSTIILLLVGFIALLAIVGTTIWLGENAQRYVDEAFRARETRISAVELRSALQSAESSQRGFLVGGNEIYLAPYANAKSAGSDPVRTPEGLAGFVPAGERHGQAADRRYFGKVR